MTYGVVTMNDLEICKSIAGIEGLAFQLKDNIFGDGKSVYANIKNHGGLKIYNPLIDDALCFQLMVKYKVDVEHEDLESGKHRGTCQGFKMQDTSTNKAICLAIIEAHKEK